MYTLIVILSNLSYLTIDQNRSKHGDDIEIGELWKDIQRMENMGGNSQELDEVDRFKRLQVIKEMPVPFRVKQKLR